MANLRLDHTLYNLIVQSSLDLSSICVVQGPVLFNTPYVDCLGSPIVYLPSSQCCGVLELPSIDLCLFSLAGLR